MYDFQSLYVYLLVIVITYKQIFYTQPTNSINW